MSTATELLAAACESKIACLENKDLLIVIAEALAQGAGGGGGEEAAMHDVTFELDNDDVLALHNGFAVVPPTEVLGYSGQPSQMPIIVSAVLMFTTWGGAYNNAAGVDLLFAYGSDFSADASTTIDFNGMVTTGPVGRIFHLISVDGVNVNNNIEDNGIYLFLSGAVIDGNAANRLRITLTYRVWDLATGTYV